MSKYRQPEWMRTKDIAEREQISTDCLNALVFNHKGKHFIRPNGVINVSYLYKFRDFKEDLYKAQEKVYFELMEHTNAYRLAREMASRLGKTRSTLNTYLSTDLWSTKSKSLTNLYVPKELVRRTRCMRRILADMENRGLVLLQDKDLK